MKRLFIFLLALVLISGVSAFSWNDGTLVSYYKLDESSGSILDAHGSNGGTYNGALYSQIGKINTAIGFDGDNDYISIPDTSNELKTATDGSISLWFKTNTILGQKALISTGDSTSTTIPYFFLGIDGDELYLTGNDGANNAEKTNNSNLLIDTWYHAVWTNDGTNNSFYLNGILKTKTLIAGSTGKWFGDIAGTDTFAIGVLDRQTDYANYNGTIDEIGIWDKSLSSTEVEELYNSGNGLPYGGVETITLESPINGTIISDIGANFTVSGKNISAVSGNWENVTYYVWENETLINSTTILVSGETFNETKFIDNFTFSDYEWNAEACYTNVTGSYCSYANNNNTFTVSLFTLIEENYVNETISGTLENFSISIDILEGYSLLGAEFMYNGTMSSPSIIAEGDNRFLLVADYQIPILSADKNITFYWEVSFSDGISLNSTERTQSVLAALLDDCSSYSYHLFNISLFDEKTKASLNGDIQMTYTLLNKPAYQEINTHSFSATNVSNVNICSVINLTDENLAYSAEIRYESDGYVPELYNIQRDNLDENVNILNLYDLKENESTEFLIKYQDNSLITVEGAIIQLLRKYINENTYETIEAPLTSNIGTAVVHVDLDANLYKAIVTKDGEVLDIFDNLVFNCESELTGQCTQNLFGTIDPQNSVPISIIEDFVYSISGVDNTITTTFSIPSGSPAEINIVLNQKDMFGEVYLCNETIISSSGSIECSYNDTLGDSIIELYLFKDGGLIVQQSYFIKEAGTLDWLGNNFFIVLILFLSIVGMGMASPEWIIINGVITMVLCGGIWLLNGLNFVMGLGTLMWLIVAAMILIMKISKQEDR